MPGQFYTTTELPALVTRAEQTGTRYLNSDQRNIHIWSPKTLGDDPLESARLFAGEV